MPKLTLTYHQFIHDPLLTWRLGNKDSPPEPSFPSERRASIIGSLDAPPTTNGVISNAVATNGALTTASAAQARDQMPLGSVPGRPGGVRGRGSIALANAPEERKEVQNARALQVLARVKEKLTGRDFKKEVELEVPHQVERLLSEATNLENLCQHYGGWCSFW